MESFEKLPIVIYFSPPNALNSPDILTQFKVSVMTFPESLHIWGIYEDKGLKLLSATTGLTEK